MLVSEPFLTDPEFSRAVVLLAEHDSNGTIGFVVNHVSMMLMDELVEGFGDLRVYYGGPVATDTIHFIHRRPDLIPDGRDLGKGIYWGGNFEVLTELIDEERITDMDVKFMLGYSGWDVGQLDKEMEQNSWIVSNQFDADLVFESEGKSLWKDMMVNLGPKYAQMIHFPKNPSLN